MDSKWFQTIRDPDKLRIIKTLKVISVVDILEDNLRKEVDALIPPLTGT